MKLFTVYDSKAELYLPPFNSQTTNTALRAFESASNQEGHDFNIYAADYTLFEIGEFDQDLGELQPYAAPNNLGTALQFKTPAQVNLANIKEQTR